MSKFIKILALVFIMVVSAVIIGGCNTVEGFGKDLESTGQAIQSAAD